MGQPCGKKRRAVKMEYGEKGWNESCVPIQIVRKNNDEVIGNIFGCREFTETLVENNIKLCYDSKHNCENTPEKKSNWTHNI
jgi:hypothetical protein